MALGGEQWVMEKLFGPVSEDAQSRELTDHVREISSIDLDRLVNEPDRLEVERTNVKQETEGLAFTNYKTFIQAANCSKQIYDDVRMHFGSPFFTLIERHLDTVVTQLPQLHDSCGQFIHDAAELQRKRVLTSQALNKHSQLLEVLEIPQLMDSCVRAGYWEEALELSAYVAKLQRRLQHIDIIQSIAHDTQRIQQTLVQQLVEQLNTQLSLPQCLKVIGFLRRLNVFTEPELRNKFLEARDGWLQSVLSGVPTDDAYQHASKCMELLRVHLFDICTQYKAVFPDDDLTHLVGSSSSSGRHREALPTNLPAIFHSWIHHKVHQIISLLEADVRRGGGGRLDSLLSQAMYFGSSFGRIGADFRSHLVPVFYDAAWSNIEDTLNTAHASLMSEMSDLSCLDSMTGASGAAQMATASSTTAGPPVCLMEWNALAVYFNFIMQCLNNNRACLPLAVCGALAGLLQTQLLQITQKLAHFKSELDPRTAGERTNKLSRAGDLVCSHLVPHLNHCLDVLFPSAQLLALFNLSAAKMSRISFCRLDAAAIAAPLQPPPEQQVPIEQLLANAAIAEQELGNIEQENTMPDQMHANDGSTEQDSGNKEQGEDDTQQQSEAETLVKAAETGQEKSDAIDMTGQPPAAEARPEFNLNETETEAEETQVDVERDLS